jgi:hypothetical protein
MKLAIVWTHHEVIALYSIIQDLNHEVILIIDHKHHSYHTNTHEYSMSRYQVLLDIAQQQWVTHILTHPLIELSCRAYNLSILPIYQTYLLHHVLRYSHVGKIGILSDHYDIHTTQQLITSISTQYTLSHNQSTTKTFHQPLARWTRDISNRSQLIPILGHQHRLLRKYIKHDLRYFQNADVDTLIPTSYLQFALDTTLRHHLNFKRVRWYDRNVISEIITSQISTWQQGSLSIISNQPTTHLYDQYPTKGLLKQGFTHAIIDF